MAKNDNLDVIATPERDLYIWCGNLSNADGRATVEVLYDALCVYGDKLRHEGDPFKKRDIDRLDELRSTLFSNVMNHIDYHFDSEGQH